MPAVRFDPMELTLPPGTMDGRFRDDVAPDDLLQGPVTVHAFCVRSLLPIHFDVQCMEWQDGTAPTRKWTCA